jgi:hypothetical protein
VKGESIMSEIYDDRGTYLGSINSSGEMFNERGDYLGSINKSGSIYDYRGNYLGCIRSNGYIYLDGNYVGLIDENGYVYRDGSYVGHIDGYKGPGSSDNNAKITSVKSNSGGASSGKSQSGNNGRISKETPIGGGQTNGMDGLAAFLVMIVIIGAIVSAIVKFALSVFDETANMVCSTGIISMIALSVASTFVVELRSKKQKDMDNTSWIIRFYLCNFIFIFIFFIADKFILNSFRVLFSEVFRTICVSILEAILMTIISMLVHHFLKIGKAGKQVTVMLALAFTVVFSVIMNQQEISPYKMYDPNDINWGAAASSYNTDTNSSSDSYDDSYDDSSYYEDDDDSYDSYNDDTYMTFDEKIDHIRDEYNFIQDNLDSMEVDISDNGNEEFYYYNGTLVKYKINNASENEYINEYINDYENTEIEVFYENSEPFFIYTESNESEDIQERYYFYNGAVIRYTDTDRENHNYEEGNDTICNELYEYVDIM